MQGLFPPFLLFLCRLGRLAWILVVCSPRITPVVAMLCLACIREGHVFCFRRAQRRAFLYIARNIYIGAFVKYYNIPVRLFRLELSSTPQLASAYAFNWSTSPAFNTIVKFFVPLRYLDTLLAGTKR